MKLIKVQIIFLLSVFIYTSSISQDAQVDSELLSVEKLKADLQILKENLEAIHAGLYTYTTKAEMDAHFDDLATKMTKPMSEVDFYRLVLTLNDKIKNGHTLIIPPESWSKYVAKEAVHIPVDIYTTKDKVFVLRNFSTNESIKRGSEIISIDGVPIQEILENLVKHSNKDGDNATYPLVIINQDFSECYANMIDTKTSYQLELAQGDRTVKYEVKGMTIEAIQKVAKERYDFDKRPWYNDNKSSAFQFAITDEIAILTLPTFNIYSLKDDGIDYKSFYKNAFEKIDEEKISNLIIDLRGNGGGYGDVGNELFSYLHDEPFLLLEDIHTITRKIPNKELYEKNGFGQLLQMKVALKKESETRYVPRDFAAKRNHLTLTEIAPSFPQYKGEIYVLTDGWVFSASAMFAALIKNYDKGVFIGEETGGNPKVQVGDFEQMLTLPSSGVRIRIPLFYEEMAVSFPNTNKGIKPDFYQRNNIAQEIEGKDQTMDWAIEFVKNH